MTLAAGSSEFGDIEQTIDGFVVRRSGAEVLFVRADLRDPVIEAGLDRGLKWRGLLERSAVRSGRGATAHLPLAGGPAIVLKQMRRGGLAATVWRDRFAGTARLLDNVRHPLEIARRGIPTAPPVALLLAPGPPGLWRAWIAYEKIEQAPSLAEHFRGTDPPSSLEIDAVAALIRSMHDRGIDHPDLNLGNLLLRRRSAAPPETFVIDLDRARLLDGSLPPHRRARALQRVERSTVKLLGEHPATLFDLRRRWYEAYAGDDVALARRLRRAQRSNRLWLRFHRLGWR